jgi:HAE1 family hydrophobic/amphiphilic exporter-1
LNQVIFTWGQVSAAIRAAEVGLATAEDQLRLFRQAALRDVSAAFYDILLAREAHDIAEDNLRQKERHLDEAQRRFAAGLATDYDVLAAQVALANARPEAIRAANALNITRERLGFLLGVDGRWLEVEGTLACDLQASPSYDATFKTALTRRPEMDDLAHRREIAKEVVTVYRAGNKPRLDAQVQYGWADLESGRSREEGMSGLAGIFITWPLFDGLRTQGRVAQAKSDERTLALEEAKLKDSISLEVSQGIKALVENAEIVRGLGETVVQARRLLFMAEKGFEHGVKTRLEVEDAQFNLKQAKGNLARARRDYLVARVTLWWTMGVLGEEREAGGAQAAYLHRDGKKAN